MHETEKIYSSGLVNRVADVDTSFDPMLHKPSIGNGSKVTAFVHIGDAIDGLKLDSPIWIRFHELSMLRGMKVENVSNVGRDIYKLMREVIINLTLFLCFSSSQPKFFLYFQGISLNTVSSENLLPVEVQFVNLKVCDKYGCFVPAVYTRYFALASPEKVAVELRALANSKPSKLSRFPSYIVQSGRFSVRPKCRKPTLEDDSEDEVEAAEDAIAASQALSELGEVAAPSNFCVEEVAADVDLITLSDSLSQSSLLD